MTERPINLRRHEVTGVLSGRQTQLRRIIKTRYPCEIEETDDGSPWPWYPDYVTGGEWDDAWVLCPFGEPGDRLWGRETWRPMVPHCCAVMVCDCGDLMIDFAAGGDATFVSASSIPAGWTAPKSSRRGYVSPLNMPRWASRILLEVTDVRVERVQDGEGETGFESRYLAEGINRIHHGDGEHYYSALRDEPHPKNWVDPFDAWRELWTSIHGPGSWDANPWTWVIGFRRLP